MTTPLLLLLAACTPPSGGWLFSVDDPDVVHNTDDCTENFLAAECGSPAAAADLPKSATALFGNDGVSDFVLLDGELLRREREAGLWVYRSESDEATDELERGQDGYFRQASRQAGRTLELTLWNDGDNLEGLLVESTYESATWAETDLWYKGGETSWGTAADLANLQGTTSNFVTAIDCESEPCRITRSRSREVVREVHAER